MATYDTLSVLQLAGRFIAVTPMHRTNRSFIFGDHWQNGAGWVGPMLKENDLNYNSMLEEIRRAFVAYNALAEVSDRHTNGVVGRFPHFGWTVVRPIDSDEELTEEEKSDIKQLKAWCQWWVDNRPFHELLQLAVFTMLWAERGVFRLYVPAGLLTTNVDGKGKTRKTVSADSIDDALRIIWPDAPDPFGAGVAIDEFTKQPVGVVRWRPKAAAAVENTGVETIEVIYLQDTSPRSLTVHRTQTGGGKEQRFTFNFGGRIPMFQMERTKPFITEQMRENQRALNLASSMRPRNVVTGGFLERTFLNTQMPGTWETDKDGNRVRFIPGKVAVGAGATNFFQGIDYQEDDGKGGTKTMITTPQVVYRDPVDVTSTLKAKESHYRDILAEADQLHVLMNSAATPTGESREQARADYEASLNGSKSTIDRCGRWIMETLIAMAEEFTGSPGKYTSRYRATFQCHVFTGPANPDDRRQNNESVEKGLLSEETAMHRAGVEDVAAERERISSQPGWRLARATKMAEIVDGLVSASLPQEAAIKFAAKMAGLTEDDVKDLLEAAKKIAAAPMGDPNAPGGGPKPAPLPLPKVKQAPNNVD